MQKDFKIGLVIGMALVVSAAVWLCTLPKLSTESRALQNASTRPTGATTIPQPDIEIQSQTRSAAESPFRVITPKTPAEEQPASPAPVVEQTARFHVVQKGDTLSGICEKYYGSPRYQQTRSAAESPLRKILNANRAILSDPNKLTPGTRLVIPE